MTEAIIVINAGSTSLKFGAYAVDAARSLPLLCRGEIDGMEDDPHFVVKMPPESNGTPMPGAKTARSITRRRCNSSSHGWKLILPT